MSLTEYQNLLRDVGSPQSVHSSGQTCSSHSPAADTGVKHFGGVEVVRSIIAPSHEEHLNVEIVRITHKLALELSY